jgi:hypothetical protein
MTARFPVSHSANIAQGNLASVVFSNIAALFVKVSLLVLYLRIFRPDFRARILIWAGVVFIALFYVATVIAQIRIYIPPGQKDVWTSPRPSSFMLMVLNTVSVQGVVGAVTDFYILFIPLHLVLGMRSLPLGKKIGVSGIFLTGLM